MLQTSLDRAVLPGPILSGADVVKHILDFVVAKRLPSVVLEDSVLYASRTLAHLAFILLMSLPLPKFLADLQELDLLPEKISITVPSVFEEIAHLLHVRAVELASAHCNCSRFILTRGSNKFSLLTEDSTSNRSALIVQSFSCSLCNQFNRFLRSQTAATLRGYVTGPSLIGHRMETVNILQEVASSL